MKRTISTQKLCVGALLVAVSLLLPQLFHLIGGQAAGGLFLPMHLPVLVAGLLLGPAWGTAVGVLAPLVSFFVTGMPPAAKLPFMLIEVTAYGLLAGLLTKKKWNLYAKVLLVQAGGRILYAASLLVAAYVLRLRIPAAAAIGTALVTGIPGVALQLVSVPPLVSVLRRMTQKLGWERKENAI